MDLYEYESFTNKAHEDNLAKRREVSDKTRLFCSEAECIYHLFFDCCVAKALWAFLAENIDMSGEWSYEFVATFWLTNKKHLLTNVIFAAALWCLWKSRNKLCFQGAIWSGMELVLWTTKTLRRWKPLLAEADGEKLDQIVQKMELEAARLPRICWSPSRQPISGSHPSASDFIAVTPPSCEPVLFADAENDSDF